MCGVCMMDGICRYLEERLTTYKNKYEVLEKRHALEKEGFSNEFVQLRSRLRAQEKAQGLTPQSLSLFSLSLSLSLYVLLLVCEV